MKKIITCIFSIIFINNLIHAETLIHAGKVIDGISNKIQPNMTIHIEGNIISNISSGFAKPSDKDKVINLKESTVLPGLIDTHVHLTGEYNAKSQLQRFVLNEADYALNASLYAKKTLEAGFTVVRNLGDSYNATIALRKAINNKVVPGPLILTAGKTLSSTGGHGDSTNGWAKSIMGDHGPKNGIVNGADDARKAV
ncbi:MAG: amidohydrolase family protein, partial [Woeseiaceae bacterium]|nr:amidohydrolase family protein [Woeseiaceae bacterium]